MGRAGSALPDSSNVDLFRYCKGVIHLDAKITHRAFYLGVAEQTRVIMHLLLTH
jgi:hypothetical protein